MPAANEPRPAAPGAGPPHQPDNSPGGAATGADPRHGGSPTDSQPLYTERLFPKWWVWLALIALVGSIAVAYGYALGSGPGQLFFAVGSTIVVLGLLVSTPRIVVGPESFRAGRAVLPAEWIGKVAELDEDASESARTTQADPRAYLLLRTVTAPRSVIVEVTDPEDPHPYWLVSTRHPRDLAAALVRIRP